MPQQPDPRFTPDVEEEDPRFIPDTPEPSLWDRAITPLSTLPSEIGTKFADWYTKPTLAGSPTGEGGFQDYLAGVSARARGFLGGAAEGLGNVASELTSPLNLATMGAFKGSTSAIKKGLPEIGKALGYTGKALSVPFAAHGGYKTLSPESSLAERGMGLAELAGGMAGVLHTPTGARRGLEAPSLTPDPTSLPIRPSISPQVAEAVQGKLKLESTKFDDITGPNGITADLTSVNGIHQAYNEGKINQKVALNLLEKYYKEQSVPIESTTETPVPLTTEAKPDVKYPPGVQEAVDLMKSGAIKNVAQLQKETGLSFARTKVIWQAAKEQIKAAEMKPGFFDHMAPETKSGDIIGPKSEVFDASETSVEGVQKAFREGRINEETALTKIEEIIKGEAPPPPYSKTEELTYIVKRGEASKGVIGKARAEGYEFVGLTDEGNFKFKKVTSANQRLERSNVSMEGPEAARTRGGGIKIGADVKSLGKVLGSSLYSGDISTIATKELIQNSLDAIGPAGANLGAAGKISVNFHRNDRTISVIDNGLGMTKNEVETVFTDLGSSGKRDIESAIGGFGLAKAAPLLGGEHVEFETISYNKKTKQIVKIAFEGTPDDLLSGVDLHETVMPTGTQTGTTVTVKVPTSNFYGAMDFAERVSEHSEFEGNIHINEGYGGKPRKLIKPGMTDMDTSSMTFGQTIGKKYTPLTTISTPQADVTLSVPPKSQAETSRITLILKNKGMYQSRQDIWLNRAMPDIPDTVTVNISSKVPEGHADYPFTANREQLRGDINTLVKKYIDDNIIEPAKKKYGQGVQDLYDGMKATVTKTGKNIHFYDTGQKFTPAEFNEITSNPIIHELGDHIDTIIRQALNSVSNATWTNRLEKIGIIFDGKLRGIHIPNPSTGKSAILVNPLQLMTNRTPNEAVSGLLHTSLHEVAHIEPTADGHGESFCIRLGDIYEKFGGEREVYYIQQLRNFITGGADEYTPEIQKLLQIYSESRGRGIVADDILTRTGSGSKIKSGGEEVFSPGSKPTGKGTLGNIESGRVIVIKSAQATPPNVKRLYDEGFRFIGENDKGDLRFKKTASVGQAPILEEDVGLSRPTKRGAMGQLGPIQDAQKASAVMEAFNFPRGVLASTDLSAPLRQGLPFIHKKEFWKAMKPMMQSWATEEGFQASQNSIANRPLFKKRVDPVTNKILSSFADDAGLKLTDLTDLTNREEVIMSTWAESGGMFERNKWMTEHGGKQAAELYRATAGGMVRRSNRSYTAFLNNLRADVFESLVKDGKIFQAGIETNLPLARSIADFVNTATGRGSLGKLEASATVLNTALFATRLISSRVKMLNILNPHHFIYQNALVRKEALKSLFAIAAFGSTVLQLSKMAGAEVSTDPNSTDFGKAQIGNVRVDPWGGFQQYIVAANKLIRPSFAKVPGLEGGTKTGMVPFDLATGFMGRGGQGVTSSTTSKEYDLWKERKGPYDPSHLTIGSQFLRNKTNPVLGFAWSILTGFTEVTGKRMNFETMNPMENAVAQRFIPILMQDIYQLAKENPELLPLAIPAGFGMGIQTYEPKEY